MMAATLVLAACTVSDADDTDWTKLHSPLTGLLSGAVKGGVVDYAWLKKREAELDAYLDALARARPASRSRSEKLAFWINAYNAFTLKLILRHYPDLESIRDIEKPWDTSEWKAGGKTLSLNEIEHEILRKELKEPRIHFAIVCASFSCPDLAPQAYAAEKLEEQLDSAARGFLDDTKKGFRVAEKSESRLVVEVSRLFDWFEDDFKSSAGSVRQYLLKYLPKEKADLLKAPQTSVRIKFLGYDWSLNGK